MKFFLVSAALLIGQSLFCQSEIYWKTSFFYEDGKVEQSHTQFRCDYDKTKIKFKNADKKKIKLSKISNLDSVRVQSPSGNSFLLINSRMRWDRGEDQVHKDKFWALHIRQNSQYTFYVSGDCFTMDLEDEFLQASSIYTSDGVDAPAYVYYVKKAAEKLPWYWTYNISSGIPGAQKTFRKQTAKVFPEFPRLQEKIKDKEFTYKNIDEVIDWILSR